MPLKFIRLSRGFFVGSTLISLLGASPLSAEAYAPGTFTFKPFNVNLGNYALGFRQPDSKIITAGIDPLTQTSIPVNLKENVYRSPVNFGFAESDRNGYGYGVEAGYVIGWDTEIYGRIGMNRQRGTGKFLVGDYSFRFQHRDNYGFALGARHYLDFQSSWKPFFGANMGLTKQGSANAKIYGHHPFNGFYADKDQFIGKYRLAKSSTLINFEISAGTDYAFTKRLALSLSIGLRYAQRGGGSTVQIPAFTPTNPFPFPLPARSVTYADNKQHWYVPITASLKFML